MWPEQGRGQFIAAAMAGFAAFALLGLFSSLVPGFIGGALHQGSHAVQGAVVFGVFAVATLTQVALARFSSRRVVLAGLALFLVALALITAALAQAAMALFLAGTVAGGAAVGAIFGGSLADELADHRAGPVLGVFADEASLAAFGANPLNPACRAPSARAGRDQGRRQATQLAAFLAR